MVKFHKSKASRKNSAAKDIVLVVPSEKEKQTEIKKDRLSCNSNPKENPCKIDVIRKSNLMPRPVSTYSVRRETVRGVRPLLTFLPTYQLEPREDGVFDVLVVQDILKDTLEQLDVFYYTPQRAEKMSMSLSEEIKNRVKKKKYNRYKIITVVTIGMKESQSLRCLSRCLWGEHDRYVNEIYENPVFYCIATVYAVYFE